MLEILLLSKLQRSNWKSLVHLINIEFNGFFCNFLVYIKKFKLVIIIPCQCHMCLKINIDKKVDCNYNLFFIIEIHDK